MPLDDLERHLGTGLAMQADERGIRDADQRVVHLEVEERADAELSHLVEAARRAAGAGGGQRGERAAVAVGRQRHMIPGRQQHLAGGAVDGRHLPLDEEPDVLEAEPAVSLEEVDGRPVVLGAGHDVQGDPVPMAPGQRQDFFGVDLEERRRGDRADREGALGPLEPEPGARAAGDQDHADLARGDGVGTDAHRPADRHALAVGLGQADDFNRANPIIRRCGRAVAPHQLFDKPIELVEVDRRDLRRQPRSLVDVQLAPPAKEVTLPVPLQTLDQLRFGGHQSFHSLIDSAGTDRARPSRAVAP